MHAVFKTAQAHRDVLVNLQNYRLGALAHRLEVRTAGAEIEPAVLIHGCHLEHGHVQSLDAVAVVAGQLGIAQRDIIGESLPNSLALNAAHMPGVPGEVAGSIGNVKNSGTTGQNSAADIDIRQLREPLCQRPIQSVCSTGAPAIIHPHSRLHRFNSFICGGQLLLILFLIAHDDSSHCFY